MPCLWFCLTPESQDVLRHVQSHNHHRKLVPPGESVKAVNVSTVLESTQEIGKLMSYAKVRGE